MKEQLQGIFEKWRGRYSGALLIRTAGETLLAEAAGYAHKGFLVPNRIDTRFDTASVTKVFTATAILQLIQQGTFRLDTRIAEVLDLRGTAISKEVTLAHLLTHTSGIADDAEEEAGEDYAALFVDKPNYSIRENRDFLPQFVHKPPNFAPGSAVRYNNCAFVLLGLALEAATGMGYREYVSTHIFEACGMSYSRFCAMDEVNPNTAEGYVAVTDEAGGFVRWMKNIYSYPPIGTADGGAYTTVGDLDVFIRALRGGDLLSREYGELICRPHCPHTRPHKYGTWRTGYAFEFIEDASGEMFCMVKDGLNAGVEAMLAYYPDFDLSVSLLSNENGALYGLHREIQAHLFALLEAQK